MKKGARTESARDMRRLVLLEGPIEQHRRPKTRGECVGGVRPCPFMSCRHHLFIEVTATGGIAYAFPDKELHELKETCSLDVADRGPRSLLEVGELFGVTRERIRQLEGRALQRLNTLHGEPLGGVFEEMAGDGPALPAEFDLGVADEEVDCG